MAREGGPDRLLLGGRTPTRQRVLHAGKAERRSEVDVGDRIERTDAGAEQRFLHRAVAEVGRVAQMPGHRPI